MPLYEYICEQTGDVLELRRSMSQADDPVEDPEGRGRVFTRKLSTFQAKSTAPKSSAPLPMGGGCGCGRPGGGCGIH